MFILGPSGSGKSTLLNMLGGLDSLDKGELTVGGRKLTGLSKNKLTQCRKEDVGFVFQFYNLIPDLTVEENIEVVSDIAENRFLFKRDSKICSSSGVCSFDCRLEEGNGENINEHII